MDAANLILTPDPRIFAYEIVPGNNITAVDVQAKATQDANYIHELGASFIPLIYALLPLHEYFDPAVPNLAIMRKHILTWATLYDSADVSKQRKAALQPLNKKSLQKILMALGLPEDDALVKGRVAPMRTAIEAGTVRTLEADGVDSPGLPLLLKAGWCLQPVGGKARKGLELGHRNEGDTRKALLDEEGQRWFGGESTSIAIVKMLYTGIVARRDTPSLRASPDDIALVDITHAPTFFDAEGTEVDQKDRKMSLWLVEYKCATNTTRQQEEASVCHAFHPTAGARDPKHSILWLDMGNTNDRARFRDTVRSFGDRVQLAQGAAVLGITSSLYVQSYPGGKPIRLVAIKWPSSLLTDLREVECQFLGRVAPWCLQDNATPTRTQVAIACRDSSLGHSRSIDAATEFLQVSAAVFKTVRSPTFPANTEVKKLHVGAAVIWNSCKGSDDSRTGLQNKVKAPTPRIGPNGLITMRIFNNVVLNLYDLWRFKVANPFAGEGGCDGNVKKWQASGNRHNMKATLFASKLADSIEAAERARLGSAVALREDARGTSVRRSGRVNLSRVSSGFRKDAHHSTPGKSPRNAEAGSMMAYRLGECPGDPCHLGWKAGDGKRNCEGALIPAKPKVRECQLEDCPNQTKIQKGERKGGRSPAETSFECSLCKIAYCVIPGPRPTKQNNYKIPKATVEILRPGEKEGKMASWTESCFQRAHREGREKAMASANERVDKALNRNDGKEEPRVLFNSPMPGAGGGPRAGRGRGGAR